MSQPRTDDTTPNGFPEVMNLETAARYLGIHPETLRLKALRGEIPGGKPGGWRFLKAALNDFLAGRAGPEKETNQ